VVSCARRATPADEDPVYEVTLLFSSLRQQDRRKLRHLANLQQRPGTAAEEDESTLCEARIQGAVFGLN
jgi:hypothetical protein